MKASSCRSSSVTADGRPSPHPNWCSSQQQEHTHLLSGGDAGQASAATECLALCGLLLLRAAAFGFSLNGQLPLCCCACICEATVQHTICHPLPPSGTATLKGPLMPDAHRLRPFQESLPVYALVHGPQEVCQQHASTYALVRSTGTTAAVATDGSCKNRVAALSGPVHLGRSLHLSPLFLWPLSLVDIRF